MERGTGNWEHGTWDMGSCAQRIPCSRLPTFHTLAFFSLDPLIGRGVSLCLAAPGPRLNAPMGYWFRIGDFELLVVSDGVIRQDAGATFGIVPRVMWEKYVPDIDDKYRLPVGLNSLVIRGSGKTVLVDTGCGCKIRRRPGASRRSSRRSRTGTRAAAAVVSGSPRTTPTSGQPMRRSTAVW